MKYKMIFASEVPKSLSLPSFWCQQSINEMTQPQNEKTLENKFRRFSILINKI
jgi:hypothetical protein